MIFKKIILLVLIFFFIFWNGCTEAFDDQLIINPDNQGVEIIGMWTYSNIDIEFFDNDSFELYKNGLNCSDNGFYFIDNDTIELNYYDYHLNWQFNKYRIYYQILSDSECIFINDIYKKKR